MNRIARLSKSITSLSIILMAAVLCISAIQLVEVAGGDPDEAVVLTSGFYTSQTGMAETDRNPVLAPGYYYTTTAALAVNVGAKRAIAELVLPKIYLTRDEWGYPLKDGYPLEGGYGVLAPDGMVTIKVDVLTPGAVDVPARVNPNGGPVNLNYADDQNGYYRVMNNRGRVYHQTLQDTVDGKPVTRHFFTMDTGWDEKNGSETERKYCVLSLRITIDAKTNAGKMGNEWQGMVIDGLGFKAARSDSDVDKADKLKLTPAQINSLKWAKSRSFYIAPASV